MTTVYLIGVSDLKPPLQPDRSIDLEEQGVLSGSQGIATTVSRGFELYSFMLALIAASTFSHIVRRRLQRF